MIRMTHVLDPDALSAPDRLVTQPLPPYVDVTRSDSAFRAFLHGLPGVDQVGAEARAAQLATRSIKTTAKAWAIDTATNSCGTTSGRGARPPSASRRANASTSDAKSVPALPRNTSMPRSASSSRYASAVVV